MTESQTLLREIANNWMLLAMLFFVLGTWVWAFRPGSRALHDDISQIPFRNDELPADDTAGCKSNCPNCTCTGPDRFLKEVTE